MIWLLTAEDTVVVGVGVEVEGHGDIILIPGLDLVLGLILEAVLVHIPVHLLTLAHQGMYYY